MVQVVLSSQSEELLQRLVDSGRYGDASAVLEEALLTLDEYQRVEALRAAVAIGDAEIERGEVALFTPELVEKMHQRALEKLAAGHTPNPDVCP